MMNDVIEYNVKTYKHLKCHLPKYLVERLVLAQIFGVPGNKETFVSTKMCVKDVKMS